MIHEPLAAPAPPPTPAGARPATSDGQRRPTSRGRGRSTGRATICPPISPVPLRHPDAPAAAPNALRNKLVALDGTVVVLVWALVFLTAPLTPSPWVRVTGPVVALVVTILTMSAQQLYRSRVGADRRMARRRLAAAALAAPAALVVAELVPLGDDGWPARLALGAVATFVALAAGREVFEQWLRSSRVRGRHVRLVVVSGTDDEARHVVKHLEAHPEIGCRAVGRVGPRPVGARDPDLALVPWIAEPDGIVAATTLAGANGVVIAPSAACDPAFPALARDLQTRHVHVQVASGLWGIDPSRLRRISLAHEPFFYLEPARQGAARRRVKRVADVVIATVVLILAAPVMAVAAILVKAHDRGPVLFRQVRIGLGGEPFALHKFRTMVIDAERRQAALADQNERSGPLFKMDGDPRVTPVGRFLRATSIDELPQLIDVLAGRLSLVGPRPALPDEVAAFDEVLLGRHRVLPGVTGLWQVEARHNPSFDAYRHLDLFYVENWTLGLDLAILAATVKTVVTDAAGALATRGHRAETLPQEIG